MKRVVIHTDGSADNRVADFGGAAAVIRYGKHYKEIVSGSWSSTTNNRMELLAIILGLENIKSGFKIDLITDSEVCLKWINQLLEDELAESTIRASKNGDLLLRLNEVLKKHSGNIEFKWVRGHTGVKDNERCDELAGQAALRDNPTRDVGSGIGECPKLGWWRHDESGTIFLDKDIQFIENDGELSMHCDYIGSARKMSKKEITNLLKEIGLTNSQIKEYEIDTSYYKKPI